MRVKRRRGQDQRVVDAAEAVVRRNDRHGPDYDVEGHGQRWRVGQQWACQRGGELGATASPPDDRIAGNGAGRDERILYCESKPRGGQRRAIDFGGDAEGDGVTHHEHGVPRKPERDGCGLGASKGI